VPAYDLAVTELVEWKRAGLTLLTNVGNHDQHDKAGQVDAVQALAKAELLVAVPAGKKRATWEVGGLEVAAFSYFDDRARFERALERAAKEAGSGARILLFHHGFKGARVGTHLEYEVREPIDAKGVLAGHRYDWIGSGHYHAHQKILGLKGRGHYIGSPLEHTRASKDARGQKGFLVYDVSEKSFEMVPLVRPRFVELYESDLDDEGLKLAAGNFVDVTWSDYPGGREAIEKALQEAGARGWKVSKVKAERESLRAGVDPGTPPKQAFLSWLEAKGDVLEGLGLDARGVRRAGLEVLKEASEEGE
jgi:DNA repair exonuclease SbcCD nuclease subunit